MQKKSKIHFPSKKKIFQKDWLKSDILTSYIFKLYFLKYIFHNYLEMLWIFWTCIWKLMTHQISENFSKYYSDHFRFWSFFWISIFTHLHIFECFKTSIKKTKISKRNYSTCQASHASDFCPIIFLPRHDCVRR